MLMRTDPFCELNRLGIDAETTDVDVERGVRTVREWPPPSDRLSGTRETFLAIVCSDADLLAEEFDEIIAVSYGSVREGPTASAPRGGRGPAARASISARQPRARRPVGPAPDRSARQRAPPRARRDRRGGGDVGRPAPGVASGLDLRAMRVWPTEQESRQVRGIAGSCRAPTYAGDVPGKQLLPQGSTMSSESDYYRVLGVGPDADAVEIARAYRSLVRRHHPDSRDPEGDEQPAGLAGIFDAYAVLRDPARRADYDRARALRDRGHSPRGRPIRVKLHPTRPARTEPDPLTPEGRTVVGGQQCAPPARAIWVGPTVTSGPPDPYGVERAALRLLSELGRRSLWPPSRAAAARRDGGGEQDPADCRSVRGRSVGGDPRPPRPPG